MKFMKHSTSGEVHRIPDKHADQYAAEDGWAEVADPGEHPPQTDDEKERVRIEAMTPAQRFQVLMDEVKALQARVDELEKAKP